METWVWWVLGGVVGILVLAVIIGGDIWFLVRRKKSRTGDKPVSERPSPESKDKKEELMATVERVIQGLEQQLGRYKEALGQRDTLLRNAYGEITGLKTELGQWKAGVEERDGLLSTAYAEIKEKDATIRALTQQVTEAGKRIASIGEPEKPPEAPEASGSDASDADESAEKILAGPPAPPSREP